MNITPIVTPQGVNAELELEAGKMMNIVTNEKFMEECTAENLWVDYKNIVKVLSPGKKIYIDDGLISVIVREVGMWSQDHYLADIDLIDKLINSRTFEGLFNAWPLGY